MRRDPAELALGFCWHDEEDWRKLKALDPDDMDNTYEEWRKNVTSAFNDLIAERQNIRKVGVRVDALLRWCKERGLSPNADARAQHAAGVLRERGKGSNR